MTAPRSLALADFRGKVFALRNPERGDPIAGLARVLEQPARSSHTPPDFVLNLSGADIADRSSAFNELQGSYLCQHRNALVFAQNSTLDIKAGWGCESHAFRTQFIDAFQGAYYVKYLPGPRPSLTQRDLHWELSIDNLDDSQITHVAEPVFLATPLEPDNWGRWMATVVPKAVQFRDMGKGRKFFCRMARPWQRAVINDLGIADRDILCHDPGRTYLCADIATIRHSATSMTVSRKQADMYRAIGGERLAARQDRCGRRVFVSRLSRSVRNPRYRALINEPELIAALQARDFDIVEPELFTFAEQAAIFAGAQAVVGLGGAGMFNTLFCKPATKVITIESSGRYVRTHSSLFASAGLRYGVILGREDLDDTSPANRRWRIQVPQAVAAIDRFLQGAR